MMAEQKAFYWERDARPDQTFAAGFDRYVEDLLDALEGVALQYAPQIESYMKAERPWTDRTSAARNGLAAEVSRYGNGYRRGIKLEFGHGRAIEYGKYLEFKNGGAYAIVKPTLDRYGAEIARAVEELLK